jgi:hypothetical protein
MNETKTTFQTALEALGHTFTQCSDGSWDVEANPARAGEFGEITEADYAVAEAAVVAAYDAGERSASALGVTFHPHCDVVLSSASADDGVGRGSWPVY